MHVRVLCAALALSAAAGSLLPLDAELLHASVGGYAVMNCHLDFPFGHEIPYRLRWDKDGETIFSWYSVEGGGHTADRWGGRVRRVELDVRGLGRGSINISAVRETDAGLYRCLVTFPNRTPPARNNGTYYRLEVDGGNLIVTPPMNVTVLEGERAELECLPKERGSTVEWYREEGPLPPEVLARSELADNGSLVLRAASSADPAYYECRVRSPDGQLQAAGAFLDVHYKAKVVYAPKERHFPHGKPASLDCHFSANPPLTNLRWEKDGFLFDPYNVQGVFYSRNGSLLFNQVEESHEGVYSCTPYNALGTEGASPGVRVYVQRPPALRTRPAPLYVARLGATVTLPCQPATHDHDDIPILVWTRKDGSSLPLGRYSLDEGNLTIADVSEEDRGVYVCTASNEASAVSAESEFLVENMPPRAPHNLSAEPAHTQLHLSWVPGHNGLDVEYAVWYRERSVSEWRTMKILTRGATEATVLGLRPATHYELRVLSQDLIGDGLFSKPLFVRTLDPESDRSENALVSATTEEYLENEELEVTVRALDEGALVRWTRDAEDDSTCSVRWYRRDLDQWRLLADTTTRDSHALLAALHEGDTYEARVTCASGVAGRASLAVPRYSSLRGAALGAAGGALLLALAALALYAARHHICAQR